VAAAADGGGVTKFAAPFPHTIIDGYLDRTSVAAVNAEWPQDWLKEDGKNNLKWSTQALPPAARRIADAVDIGLVERETGIADLFPDPELFGGGLHAIPRGGFLKMHVDFNQHPRGWHRRVNVLIYLNDEWRDEWGGHLQLGLEEPKLIAPLSGRCVIFETNDTSWHGHPHPLACPPEVQRRSMALYFYTQKPPKQAPHTTIYQR
jgi:Rps23 Pro-64 3,4-dihydroxylase Tpa1-like proline 4-hydroxylase